MAEMERGELESLAASQARHLPFYNGELSLLTLPGQALNLGRRHVFVFSGGVNRLDRLGEPVVIEKEFVRRHKAGGDGRLVEVVFRGPGEANGDQGH
jgi:hypothetical protein